MRGHDLLLGPKRTTEPRIEVGEAGMRSPKDIVSEYMRRVGTGDIEGALALARDDALFQGPDGTVMDKAETRRLFAQVLPLMKAPMTIVMRGVTAEGARVALEATGSADLLNGRRYENRYHFLFEVEDGVIIASREYCDTRAIDVFGN